MSGTATILSIYSYPTAISWGSPHLEVFALDSADVVYWKWRNLSTTSWVPQSNALQSLSGIAAPFAQGVAAVVRGLASVNILVVGTDFALYNKYHTTDFVWGQVSQIGNTEVVFYQRRPQRSLGARTD